MTSQELSQPTLTPQHKPPQNDLTGQRFGYLVVQGFSHRDRKTPYWYCLCDCGATKVVKTQNLQKPKKPSCGCQHYDKSSLRKDLKDQRFSMLVVLETWWVKGTGYAKAQCDCGNLWTGEMHNLVRKDTVSCGCWRKESKRKAYLGERFHKLVILETWWTSGRGYSKALCDCGELWEGPTQDVVCGNTTSCGCKQRIRLTRRIDLKDQRFGKLVILETTWTAHGRRLRAQCDCGQIWTGASSSVLEGTTTSCGCNIRRSKEHKQEVMRIHNQRRYARKRNLPDLFTRADMDFMFQYWGFQCAICGREEGSFLHLIAMDHWTPLNNPASLGTVPWNILPLCHGKKGMSSLSDTPSCNTSKHDKDPIAWLTTKLGPRKARAKLREIAAYFALVKERGAACIAS